MTHLRESARCGVATPASGKALDTDPRSGEHGYIKHDFNPSVPLFDPFDFFDRFDRFGSAADYDDFVTLGAVRIARSRVKRYVNGSGRWFSELLSIAGGLLP